MQGPAHLRHMPGNADRRRAGRPRGGELMRATEIFHWEQEARAEFSYTPDAGPDVWLSHADDVLAARPWEDDCDGLASTVLDLCNRAGLDKSDAYRLRVYASNGSGGHMVGAVKDTANQFWIVGDTFA